MDRFTTTRHKTVEMAGLFPRVGVALRDRAYLRYAARPGRAWADVGGPLMFPGRSGSPLSDR